MQAAFQENMKKIWTVSGAEYTSVKQAELESSKAFIRCHNQKRNFREVRIAEMCH